MGLKRKIYKSLECPFVQNASQHPEHAVALWQLPKVLIEWLVLLQRGEESDERRFDGLRRSHRSRTSWRQRRITQTKFLVTGII